jgi:16S rRNA (guanine966-N2)-methyltransferase
MRVISGTARGRSLKAVPGTNTRPTTDKVKEAVFSMIGPYFEGGQVLDLFAGTGGLGIEALSRGMGRAVFIDMDKKSLEIIQENLKTAGFPEQAEVYRNDALRALKALVKRGLSFDLIFLDPPYRMKNMDEVLALLEEGALVRPNGTVMIEHDAAHRYAERIGSFACRRHAVYGDTAISIYTYEPNNAEADVDQGAETI